VMKRLIGGTLFVAVVAFALVSAAEAETYGGDATAVQVTVPATGTIIRAASGTLAISGGGEEASLLVGDVPGSATGGVVTLTAGALHSAIVGIGSLTSAESSMGHVNLTISGNQITSDFVMARSQAGCNPGPSVGGLSHVENLVINGQPITVTGSPNQTVTLPNGTVIINEQVESIVGNTAQLTVNALRVTTRDTISGQLLADAVLARADAKHGCEEQPPATSTKTTGGGWIPPGEGGGKATFGLAAKFEASGPPFKGHLVYKDHGAGVSLKSTEILNVASAGCSTTFSGTGEANGTPVEFEVTVTDAGEPGQDHDTFQITIVTIGYARPATLLGGGNIQVHGQTCP
jgi:hypothetical protein